MLLMQNFQRLLTFFAAILFSHVLFLVIKLFVRTRHQAILAKKWGCLPAPFDIFSDRLGVLNALRIISADREKRCPEHYIERFVKNSETYGRVVSTVACRVMGQDAYITCDPKNIQAMLATQFSDYGLGHNRASIFFPLLGHGIFSVDGPRWEHARALMRPQFARERVSELDLEERHFQNLLSAIGPPGDDGWTPVLDLQPLFFRLTLDSATEFLFGESVDSQVIAMPGSTSKVINGGVDEQTFSESFDEVQDWMAFASRLGAWHKLGHTRRFYKSAAQLHKHIDYFVNLALQQQKSKDDEDDNHGFNILKGLAKVEKDPLELRGQLLSILVAGRDSTASLLGWFFIMMCKNPDVYDKLREIVIREFGDWETCDSTDITFSSLKSCTFLQMCISETLRLFPLVPINGRTAIVKDTTLPTGGGPDGTAPVFVPKGMEIQYCVHAMHHRKDLWGEDAEEFRPERFKEARPGWEYLPFNGGPRACLGQQFALTEVAYVVVRLLQRFDNLDGSIVADRKIRHGLTLANTPYDGVQVRLHSAARGDLKS